MKKIGVSADDITGSNDIGIMFAKNGMIVHIYNSKTFEVSLLKGEVPDVIILDTDSRFDSRKTAYLKVYDAVKKLKACNCDIFYKKTCSVFRGNIGAEFDALLDALSKDFGVCVLAFPQNGRTTKKGIHYLNGIKLEESQFQNDPIHPMTKSNIVEILQEQTSRRVGLVPLDKEKELNEEIKSQYNYVIYDCDSDTCLGQIAEAIQNETVFLGASALAYELSRAWGYTNKETAKPLLHSSLKSVLCISGSLTPQTKGQLEFLKQTRISFFELDTEILFGNPSSVIEETVEKASELIMQNKDVLVYAKNSEETLQRSLEIAKELGRDRAYAGKVVSNALAEITKKIADKTKLQRLLVAGGDTSAAISYTLSIDSMRVLEEVQSGVASCLSLSERPMLFIYKSGSFGNVDFMQTAIKYLREYPNE